MHTTLTEIESYVYIMWSVGDGMSKVGLSKTKSFKRRVSAHSGNSSNPLNFEVWKVYGFEAHSDAVLIEKRTLEILRKRGLAYKDKKELFQCNPTDATSAIEKALKTEKISAYANFPFDSGRLENLLPHFIDIPYIFSQRLSTRDRAFYLHGFQSACMVFEKLSSIGLTNKDFWAAFGAPTRYPPDLELWRGVIDRIKFARSRDDADMKALKEAELEIENFNREAILEWQEGNIP